jgi:hypothetical protein
VHHHEETAVHQPGGRFAAQRAAQTSVNAASKFRLTAARGLANSTAHAETPGTKHAARRVSGQATNLVGAHASAIVYDDPRDTAMMAATMRKEPAPRDPNEMHGPLGHLVRGHAHRRHVLETASRRGGNKHTAGPVPLREHSEDRAVTRLSRPDWQRRTLPHAMP